jgi:prepilin-type N-terminal cleavage/methylation domain-containing protein
MRRVLILRLRAAAPINLTIRGRFGISHDAFSYRMCRTAGFTLVEIMIVVSVIALLVVIALPSFLHARQEAQNAKFMDGLRIASAAFEQYAAEYNAYPPDVSRGVIPSGMSTYFGPTLDWTKPTPIGGNWDWDYKVFGFTAAVSVAGYTASASQMNEIDAKIDDGVSSTGAFQDKGGRYSFIIED